MRSGVLLLVVLMTACGEPAVDVEISAREERQHVLDQAGILDAEALEQRLDTAQEDAGLDIVALTYESEQANCGEAYRAAREFVRTWEADVALVAVADPGDFTSTEQTRQRCLGVQPLDDRGIPGDLREQIAEELVPPKAADNDWDGAFAVAVEALVER